jgi:prepilin-type N-terminal cleavage/methylation domain-containing protein
MFYNSLASSKPLSQHERKAGFGLIELMVSISIMVLVSGIILSRQSGFNSAVVLRSQAYELAFAIREMQQGAVSVTNNTDGGATSFRSVLGVYVTTDGPADRNQTYWLYEDGDSNFYYTGPSENIGNPRQIDRRFYVSDIRNDIFSVVGGEISIVFERPNFDARFYDALGTEVFASHIDIDICRVGSSCAGVEDVRTVRVTEAGQIDVVSP